MKRRYLLSLIVTTSLAGCNFDDTKSSPSNGTTPTTTEHEPGRTATPVAEDPATYRPIGEDVISLEGGPFTKLRIDNLPKPVPFSGWVEFGTQPTTGEPGQLTIGIDNRGDQTLGLDGGAPAGFSESDTGLIAADNWGPTKFEEEQRDCPRGRPVAAGTSVLWSDPGQTRQTSADIFVDPRVETCFPSGEHYINSLYRIYPDRNSFENNEPIQKFHWGFTLVVE